MSEPLKLPPTTASVAIGDLQVTGTLVFQDAAGHVVHALPFTLQPLFHPHAANLETALAELLAELVKQLPAPP